jgi:hypothetical protein
MGPNSPSVSCFDATAPEPKFNRTPLGPSLTPPAEPMKNPKILQADELVDDRGDYSMEFSS